MPDASGKITKQDLREALQIAELKIAKFVPRSAPTSTDPMPSMIPEIQKETAENSAQEKADALFEFLVRFITQVVKAEIDKQQIVQRISNLEAILTRNNLT